MKVFTGKEILEVWDFRLSVGSPALYADKKFWTVTIWANDGSGALDTHTTTVETTGTPHEPTGVTACYKWLYSIRDKFAREHIELRKPVTRAINAANAKAVEINSQAAEAKAEGDDRLFNEKRSQIQAHLFSANSTIKSLTAIFHAKVAETGGAA